MVLFSSRKRARPSSDASQHISQRHPVARTSQTQQLEQDDPDNITFERLGLNTWLLSVLDSLDIKQPTRTLHVCTDLHVTLPTAVQASCIPAILQGRNVIGVAQTGSGKTAAFALPILQALAADRFGIFCLVMTPTRELALQIVEQFRAFGAGLQLRDSVVIGGTDMQRQARELSARPHVVVATPGRLAVRYCTQRVSLSPHASQGLLDADPDLAQGFARLRVVVMDEADRLLDDTFAPQLRSVLSALPTKRQTLLFSATMTQNLLQLQKVRVPCPHLC